MEWVKWKRGGRWVDNDEGWHYRHCHRCGKKTEHGIGEGCVPCVNAATARRLARQNGGTQLGKT